MEIEQKPQRHVQQFHLTQQLCLVDRQDVVDGFWLNEKTTVYEQIESYLGTEGNQGNKEFEVVSCRLRRPGGSSGCSASQYGRDSNNLPITKSQTSNLEHQDLEPQYESHSISTLTSSRKRRRRTSARGKVMALPFRAGL
jgi:hypothetical protein